ncbi:glycosyltransferase [Actinopolymorpha sp. NPDC004070]|uniref:glycosyltransferase n=1 Tax=Actinopolymorpha sp. NPDC004070 TaxID=3154548 RepID=UPI0033AB2F7E
MNNRATDREESPTNPGDRPWVAHSGTRPVDESVVAEWTRAFQAARPTAGPTGRSAGRLASGADRLSPGLTVVVRAGAGEDVAGCLGALAGQQGPVEGDRREVLVVVDGPASLDVSEAVRGLAADGQVAAARLIDSARAGTVSARDAGLAAARTDFTCFLDAADRPAPDFCAALLTAAGPNVVVVPAERADAEARLPTSVAGTLVPTGVARRAAARAHDAEAGPSTDTGDGTGLAAHADTLFLATLVAAFDCQLRLALVTGPCPGTSTGTATDVIDVTGVAARMELLRRLDVLARGAAPEALALVRARVDNEVDRLNAHLRVHPDEHAEVVAALDRHAFDYFPYHRLNRGRARALAVAYCFAPYNDTSAVVMAKRVRERGDIVDAVFNAMDGNREQDPSIRRISGPYVENEIATDTPTYFSHWGAIEAYCTAGLERVVELEREKGPYERVYSRAMWPASHFLAAAYKLHNPAATWTAEFSDPAARDVQGQPRISPLGDSELLTRAAERIRQLGLPVLESDNVLDWCEYLAYALADRLVFTNPNQLDYMLSYTPVPQIVATVREKAVISAHPTLPPAFYAMAGQTYALEPGIAHVGYFGNFYATRGLGDVLTALAGLDPATRERIRLHVFTGKADALRAHVTELGITELVRINPYVRYLAFLNLASKFDCLVVNDALTSDTHARNPYLPSKWSDYAGSGRPVWGLVEECSPMSTRPLDHLSPVGDVSAAQDVLRKLAAAASESRVPSAPPPGNRDDLSGRTA